MKSDEEKILKIIEKSRNDNLGVDDMHEIAEALYSFKMVLLFGFDDGGMSSFASPHYRKALSYLELAGCDFEIAADTNVRELAATRLGRRI